jgi:uncharacterized protein YndB with AHSA1/START domain
MTTTTKHETTLTLPSDREILLTRKFDAPCELVWDTITDPDLIPRWWGFRADTTEVVAMDVRPGGRWRYVTHTSGGEDVGFSGEYREVVRPERLVYTFVVDGMPPGDGFVEITLVERDGVTEMFDRSVFGSVEERDAVIKTGMEVGARETYERLAELLATGSA